MVTTRIVNPSSILGPGQKPVDMTQTSRTRTTRKWVSIGPVKKGEPAYEESTTTELTNEGLFEETVIKSAACAGCGRQIRSEEDASSMHFCFYCHYLLCECAENWKCDLCSRQACPACGHQEDSSFCCKKCSLYP